MELQQLRGFHAVVKCRSFTKAARSTFRTQSTVSLQIKALESELGTKLFRRFRRRGVELTPEGELLKELTEPLMNEIEQIRTRFDEALRLIDSSEPD